jgi:hypothetical protein
MKKCIWFEPKDRMGVLFYNFHRGVLAEASAHSQMYEQSTIRNVEKQVFSMTR